MTTIVPHKSNQVVKRGKTPLLTALVDKHFDRARGLINGGCDWFTPGPQGVTPFMLAARYGLTDIVGFLLEQGVDVNQKCDFGYTALMFAVHDGRADTVKFLLEHGANPNVRAPLVQGVKHSIGDDTPLYLAYVCDHPTIAQMLIDFGAEKEFIDNDGLSVSISLNFPVSDRTPHGEPSVRAS